MNIGLHELLPVGTRVKVGLKVGIVIASNMVQAVPCGLVCLHTIRFTHILRRLRPSGYALDLHPGKTQTVNYSCIEKYIE